MVARAFITGLSGPGITPDEKAYLRDAAPWGLILFKRNITNPQQVSNLIDEFREICGGPRRWTRPPARAWTICSSGASRPTVAKSAPWIASTGVPNSSSRSCDQPKARKAGRDDAPCLCRGG